MGRNRKIQPAKAMKVANGRSTLKNVRTRKQRTLRKKSVKFNLDNLSRIQERELLPYKKYEETLNIKKEPRDNQKIKIDIDSKVDIVIKTEESKNNDDFKLEDVVNGNLKQETDFEIKVKVEANIIKTETEEKFSAENDESVNYDFLKLEDIAKGNLEPKAEFKIELKVEENKGTHTEENGSPENKAVGFKHLSAFKSIKESKFIPQPGQLKIQDFYFNHYQKAQLEIYNKTNITKAVEYKHPSAFKSIKGGKFIPQPGQLKCQDFYFDHYQKVQLEIYNKIFARVEDPVGQNVQPYWEKYKKLPVTFQNDTCNILPPHLPISTTEASNNTDHGQLSTIFSQGESNDTFPTTSQASASKYDNEKDYDASNSNVFQPEVCDSQSNENMLTTAMDISEIETETPLPEISLQDIEDVLKGSYSEIPPEFPNLTYDVLLEEVPNLMDELYDFCIRNVENCESQFSELPSLNLQEETSQLELIAPPSSCVINEMMRKQNEMATAVEETAEFQSDQAMDTAFQDIMEIIDADVQFVNPGATKITIPHEQCNCATLDQETKEEFDKEWDKIMAIVQKKKDADPVFAAMRNS